MVNFHYKTYTSIADINPNDWHRFFANNCFADYPFLLSLENANCVAEHTGWQPFHIAIYDNDTLIALLPGYIKSHSYGEYVFDWAWADAYQKHGEPYYPKWICAVPFTPVTEKRIGCQQTRSDIYQYLQSLLTSLTKQHCWSGWHINFCLEQELNELTNTEVYARRGVQFSWHNKQYQGFDHFLNALTARKRKSIKKERAKALANIDSVSIFRGKQITPSLISDFYQFYCATYLKRSGHRGYLNLAFFNHIIATMPEKVVLITANKNQKMVAASLFFQNNNALYGRYWGASAQFDSLHFELCYYQGIEYCIDNGLSYFNAGAQGEHKILRGFEPEYTYSCHYINSALFKPAIANYLQHEWKQLAEYKQQCESLLPFKL